MKKKILIFGPFSDFGGREIEASFIAKSLSNEYDIDICSTGFLSKKSQIFQVYKNKKAFTINDLIQKEFLSIKILNFFSYLKNRNGTKFSQYSNNTISKKYFNYDLKLQDTLEKLVPKYDLIFICSQLSSNLIPLLVNIARQNDVKTVLRSTGTIAKNEDYDFLKNVDCFVHHSLSNANNLPQYPNFKIIDQCALNEKNLLALEIKYTDKLRFGFLGRLSEEKGILQISNFFAENNLPFTIAGDGHLKKQLLNIIALKSNCEYIGVVDCENLDYFFNKIDVLIISSFEESGPLVGLEAMAAGKIILSTNVGAMKERLKGLKSFWFQIENLSTLQLAIDQIMILSNIEKLEISDSYRKRYISKYSFKTVSDSYLKLCNKYTKTTKNL